MQKSSSHNNYFLELMNECVKHVYIYNINLGDLHPTTFRMQNKLISLFYIYNHSHLHLHQKFHIVYDNNQ